MKLENFNRAVEIQKRMIEIIKFLEKVIDVRNSLNRKNIEVRSELVYSCNVPVDLSSMRLEIPNYLEDKFLEFLNIEVMELKGELARLGVEL